MAAVWTSIYVMSATRGSSFISTPVTGGRAGGSP
jgi:hypothetical protein